jgi:hypothetical protein
VSYNVYMSTTLTVRTKEPLREALLKRADAQGKTLSELVREILEDAVLERPLGSRIGYLRGRLSLSGLSTENWRERLHDRNWRS